MPAITGFLSPMFTVTDLQRSTRWYQQLFDMTKRREHASPDGSQRDVCLVEPTTGLEIRLVGVCVGAA